MEMLFQFANHGCYDDCNFTFGRFNPLHSWLREPDPTPDDDYPCRQAAMKYDRSAASSHPAP